jgi:formylglycine-generating enzyme required for sulfatase activity
MVGCVWQWCADVADDEERDDSEVDPFTDPARYADDVKRVTRGGAWNTLEWSIRCASRNGYAPTARFSNVGFRCVVPAKGRSARR